METCLIDEFGPLPVRRPATAEELGALVQEAAAANQAVYPLGGQTMLHVGLPPTKPGVALDLRGLASVIDYPARDMTITVQAGITLAELGRLLASENQRLPVDVPFADRATLGGALAVNASGPRRFGAGTFRDYVIGLSTVNDEGHQTKAGGRVVKNVAGYDLCKLHLGALGTLGIISQVTLKVRPRPEESALLALGCAGESLGPLLEALHASRTRPISADLLNAPAVEYLRSHGVQHLPRTPWVVVVGYEDTDETVSWQVQQLLREVGAAGGVRAGDVHAGAVADSLWNALVALTAPPEAVLSCKAGLLPGRVADFCQTVQTRSEGILLYAHAGSGIVHGHVRDNLTRERASAMLEAWGAQATPPGHLTLPRCPVGWKRDLPVWGAPRDDTWLMRQVKDRLDPRRLFNPGRFPGL